MATIDEKTKVPLFAVLGLIPVAVMVLVWHAVVYTDSANARATSIEALGVARDTQRAFEARRTQVDTQYRKMADDISEMKGKVNTMFLIMTKEQK